VTAAGDLDTSEGESDFEESDPATDQSEVDSNGDIETDADIESDGESEDPSSQKG